MRSQPRPRNRSNGNSRRRWRTSPSRSPSAARPSGRRPCAAAVRHLVAQLPATIMTSDWRGLGRNTMPKRVEVVGAAPACISPPRSRRGRRSSATAIRARPVDELVRGGGDESLLRTGPLLPFQGSFHPFVDEPTVRMAREQHHRHESRQADVVGPRSPRERNAISSSNRMNRIATRFSSARRTHARVLERLEAALVRREFLGVGLVRGEQLAGTMAPRRRPRRRG